MRITPEAIVDNYESGSSVSEMVDEIFAGVTREQILTILTYAAQKGYLARPFAA